MALREDLNTELRKIFRTSWTTREGQVVPDDLSVSLGNDGVELDATILYADMADSTKMVDQLSSTHAAEIYKAYLTCAARIIRAEGGTITAYDGDRVMAAFIGDAKNSSAAKAGLRITYAMVHILRPQHDDFWKKIDPYTLVSKVGIDTSRVLVAKTGIRGANDLVWVGRSANHAAKLAALEEFSTYISTSVYNSLNADSRLASDGQDMWTARRWNTMNDEIIYGSNYWWAFP